jgi:hypothetical protein
LLDIGQEGHAPTQERFAVLIEKIARHGAGGIEMGVDSEHDLPEILGGSLEVLSGDWQWIFRTYRPVSHQVADEQCGRCSHELPSLHVKLPMREISWIEPDPRHLTFSVS